MKTLIILIFCALSTVAKAQSPSGKYLEKAGNDFQTGFWLVAVGTTITAMSTTIKDDGGVNTNQKALQFIGVGTSLVGVIFTYSGFVNIKKAGKVSATPAGLVYKF